jgi:hypothetical protein
MIRSICSVCKIQYGTKPDGRAEVSDSHGYCLKCAAEAMAEIERQFAALQQAEARRAA